MRIKCPECEAVLSLGQPKPGSYRPTCKQCKKAFRLKVTDDDPPKIGVGKLRAGGTAKKPAEQAPPRPSSSTAKSQVAASSPGGSPSKPKPNAAPAHVDATMDASTGAEATLASVGGSPEGIDATVDPASAVDATMDSSPGNDVTMASAAGAEATMDSSTGSAPAPSAADKTTANVDATMEGTMDGSHQASVSVSAGGAAASVEQASSKSVVSPGKSVVSPGKSVVSSGKSVVRSGKSVVSSGGSAAQSRGQVAKRSDSDGGDIPEKLGGYRILRLLGRGAMGAVYEAKQVSLDRLVALKTIRGRLASNPASLARFTREAYAAAQLTHHNVVQIYDFGEDAGRHFFSMEWVRGGPLDDLIRDKGPLDPRLAAGYTLQAARGLQFAHRNGMVHRDIKPANLLLSDEGVVKVADLGLVKVPDQIDPESDVGAAAISGGMESGTQVTMQGTAVGTPAYMAPEQGVDAAAVDHRADIYSLGCTLFYLLAGQPPFNGSVVSEVLDQHANQPLPSLAEINARVPEALEQVVERSMAKRPEDRYLSLSEMIDDLEEFLGVSTEGDFSPTTEQADRWERIATHFTASAPLLRLSKPILAGLVGVSGFLTLVGPFVGLSWMLLGPSLFISALVAALVLGASGPSPVVANFRAWIGSLSWIDYGIGALGAIVFLLVAMIAGMLPGFIVGGLLGAIAGAAYHFVVVAPSRRKREPVVNDAEKFIRDLRINGADEEGVRSFAARYAGKRWQEIFEALFGYDSLCKMREQLHGDPSFSASTDTSLRDKICASLASKSNANREARDLKRLAKIEERGLQSEGISAGDARERAWQMAAAVMDNAKAVAPPGAPVDAEAAAEQKRQAMKSMLAEARSGKYKKKRDKLAPLRFALGGQSRLLAGCVLLVVFAIWGNNNGLFDTLKEIDVRNLDVGDAARGVSGAATEIDPASATLLGASPWSVGIAGLLLALSSFVSGWRMTPFAVAATVVILYGHVFGIPGVGELLQPWMVSGLVGLAIYFPGILFGESKGFD